MLGLDGGWVEPPILSLVAIHDGSNAENVQL